MKGALWQLVRGFIILFMTLAVFLTVGNIVWAVLHWIVGRS